MRLILLRHEERDLLDPRFFTELTLKGKENALELVKKLNNEKIDIIFSSPFLRTLQTIYPYSTYNNQKVNAEYGLYEYIHNPIFNQNNWYHSLDEFNNSNYSYIDNIINHNYKSIIKKNDFKILEDNQSIENRLIKFFDYLLNNYHDKTVLIVSHMGTINTIKNLYIKPTKRGELFPMGHFEIYNIN